MRFRINLASLWELKRTVELGSMTKAAEELGLSQPALTRRIKQLEHDLRIEVLIRDHAGVRPTEIGTMVLSRAQDLFDQVHRLEEDIAGASGRLAGEVAVCLPTAMYRVVTRPFVKAAAQEMPDVRIRIIDAFDAVLHEQLINKNADIGIFIHDADVGVSGLRLEPLVTEQLFLVGVGDKAGERDAVRIADLNEQRLVVPSQNNGLRRKLDAAFRKAKINPDIIEIDSYQTMTDFVRSGRANTIAPSCSFAPRGRSIWWSPVKRLSINWTFAVQESRLQSFTVQSVADLLKRIVTDWAIENPWAGVSAKPTL